MECVQVAQLGLGECPNFVQGCKNCSDVLTPVFSLDGLNFGNLCKLYCNKAALCGFTKSTRDAVDAAERIRRNCGQCSKLFLPICGSDGKNYDNECLCTCQETCSKYAPGLCPTESPRADPLLGFPECKDLGTLLVCGVDSRTYNNFCYLVRAKVEVQYPGPFGLRFPSAPPSAKARRHHRPGASAEGRGEARGRGGRGDRTGQEGVRKP